MEQDRGISITSAVLKFDYDGHVLNLLDTPGHADFSEDTYRVLEAVDCAIMLLDSAKGLEPQTLKLFDVCRSRHVPVVTFVNKWDRPGREPLELLDEIEQRIGLRPTPRELAGRHRRRLPRADRAGHRRVHRLHADARRRGEGAGRGFKDPDEARAREGAAYDAAEEELALLDEIGADDRHAVVPGRGVVAGAVRRGAAQLRRAPAARRHVRRWRPRRRRARPSTGTSGRWTAPFSGLVFKVQANMDPAHRDRVAFVRVCSGRFERGMVLTHAATGRPFATKYAQAMFGQERETVDTAFPGDVIGLVNATALRPGDTLYADVPVRSRRSRRSRPSTSRSCGARTPGSTSSSGGASTSSTPRASSRCSPRTCAATRRRCSPPSGRCSSTWCCTGSSTSSARKLGARRASDFAIARLTDEAAPTRWRARAAPRCSPGGSTGRCWRCSPTSGG